jgi:hypothetical protein
MPFSFSLYCNSQLEGISSDASRMTRGWGGHWVTSLGHLVGHLDRVQVQQYLDNAESTASQ